MKTPQRLSSALNAARREWRTPQEAAEADDRALALSESPAGSIMSEQRRRQYMTFLKQYSPDIQNVFADFSPEDLYKLKRNPSLRELTGWFGKGPTLSWIELQLTRFNDFCGASEKMQAMQIEDLACLLLANFPKVTIAQFANFFARMKSGCYDRFYKTVDPMKIAASMKTYMQEQDAAFNRLREEYERRERERREAESRKRCITYEQYLELKRLNKIPPPPSKDYFS